MKNPKRLGLVILILGLIILILVPLIFIVASHGPRNMYDVYQSERLTLTHYSLGETSLTVTLDNVGTGSVDLAASQYILFWQDINGQSSVDLTITQNSCSSSVISPAATCQLTFNLPAWVLKLWSCSPNNCPSYVISFRVTTPHGASYRWTLH